MFCLLRTGHIAYTVSQASSDKVNYDATDGQYILKATMSKMTDDMVTCHLYYHPRKASKLLKADGAVVENIGKKTHNLMKCWQAVAGIKQY